MEKVKDTIIDYCRLNYKETKRVEAKEKLPLDNKLIETGCTEYFDHLRADFIKKEGPKPESGSDEDWKAKLNEEINEAIHQFKHLINHLEH